MCLVQQRDTRLDFVQCVSVLPATHSLSNKLAFAYAALTSAWSCVCTSGSEMLLSDADNVLSTDYTYSVFVIAF